MYTRSEPFKKHYWNIFKNNRTNHKVASKDFLTLKYNFDKIRLVVWATATAIETHINTPQKLHPPSLQPGNNIQEEIKKIGKTN